ncbi:MAG: hypothetical protein ACTSV7_09210 [Candidatus Baldrarchaeia archaeon]
MALMEILQAAYQWILAHPTETAIIALQVLTLLTLWKNRIIQILKSPVVAIKKVISKIRSKAQNIQQVTNVAIQNAPEVTNQITELSAKLNDLINTLKERRLVPLDQNNSQSS